MAQKQIPNPDADAMFAALTDSVGNYFPLVSPAPEPNEFEVGLVLGGTVSAAAYTAGVLDFLIQALDAWTFAKSRGDSEAPPHKVIIKIMTGTSGGGISCVLLSRTLGSAFPHCTTATPNAQRAQNKLYDVWVNQFDIRDLLQLTDLQETIELSSVLCASKFDKVCAELETYQGAALGTNNTPVVRDYFEQLLPVVLTLTNLRGVPYSSDFRGTTNRPEYYTDHADHIRFKVDIKGDNPPAPGNLAPFETGISATPSNASEPWKTIIHAARGTSAFPCGFPPQTITRDPRHYLYRYAVLDTITGPSVQWLKPAWPYMIPIGSTAQTPYQFLCVDGGCFNNEPIEFARQALAGVLGHNERRGDLAHRAVILIDPFADVPKYGLTDDLGILQTAMATVTGITSGARFDTADLDLFTSEDVFSRFLINPVRTVSPRETVTGGDAIATSSLGAFGGFLSSSFREHDFFLGRRNCQRFLQTSFMLEEKNSLFAGWTASQRQAHGKDGYLPVIPLIGRALNEEIEQHPWPKNTFAPSSIRDLVDGRITAVTKRAAQSVANSDGWPLSWIVNLIVSKLGDGATDKIMNAIVSGLQSVDLLD